jgi:hypothetical protein
MVSMMNVIGHFEIEPTRVKKEPAETRMEWDLLKKTALYFAKESPPIRR